MNSAIKIRVVTSRFKKQLDKLPTAEEFAEATKRLIRSTKASQIKLEKLLYPKD